MLTLWVATTVASTSSPTGIPSSMPSGMPSGLPTSNPTQPTSLPTSRPTDNPTQPTSLPTGVPSRQPTYEPTNPTSLPSSQPSPAPSSIPTSNPTQFKCDIDILLFDLFGDGWGNSMLYVNLNGDVQNISLSCGHCDRVSFPDAVCNATIWMESPEGEEPVTPWENYWVVGVIGQTFIGGSDTTLTIDQREIFGENLIDYNETIHCEECIHPKPAPKSPKGKSGKHHHHPHGRKLAKGPKKPPAFANSKLYDAQSNGWFVAAGWNDVCDSENCAPGDTNCTLSLPNIPNALIYPRYFILNENKTEIIHEGTICSSDRGFELCENVIPHNGDFVFRVAGIEPEGDAATWEFCGKSGGINEELQFTMKDGACIPGMEISAEAVCGGLNSSVVLSGSLLLGGIKAEYFTDLDANVLESDLKLLMPTSGVAIKSWTNTDNGLRVHFSANFISDLNLLYYHSNLDNLIATVQSDLSSSIENGVFKDQLNIGLDAYPNSQNDILRLCNEITLEGVVVYSTAYVSAFGDSERSSPISIVTIPIETTSSTHSDGPTYTISTTGAYAIVVIGIIGLAVVAVAVRIMSRKNSHERLPTTEDSFHPSSSA